MLHVVFTTWDALLLCLMYQMLDLGSPGEMAEMCQSFPPGVLVKGPRMTFQKGGVTYTITHKTDNHQAPTTQHRDLCSGFCDNLYEKRA